MHYKKKKVFIKIKKHENKTNKYIKNTQPKKTKLKWNLIIYQRIIVK